MKRGLKARDAGALEAAVRAQWRGAFHAPFFAHSWRHLGNALLRSAAYDLSCEYAVEARHALSLAYFHLRDAHAGKGLQALDAIGELGGCYVDDLELDKAEGAVLRALHLPSSVVGGLVGWILFAVVGLFGEDAEALADEWFSVGWDVLPGYCTNVVFCCLFLGTPVPQAREVLQSPRREHLLYGLVVVMGQYVVAAALTGIFIFADPALPAPFATIMPCAAPRAIIAQFPRAFRRTSL